MESLANKMPHARVRLLYLWATPISMITELPTLRSKHQLTSAGHQPSSIYQEALLASCHADIPLRPWRFRTYDLFLENWWWTLCSALFFVHAFFVGLVCGLLICWCVWPFFYRLTVRRTAFRAKWFYLAYAHFKSSFVFLAVERLRLIMFAASCVGQHHQSWLPRDCNTITSHIGYTILDIEAWLLY